MDPSQQQNPPAGVPQQQPQPPAGYGYPPYGQAPPGVQWQYHAAPPGQVPPQGQAPLQGQYFLQGYYPPPGQYPPAPGQAPPPAGQHVHYPPPPPPPPPPPQQQQQQPYGAHPGQYPPPAGYPGYPPQPGYSYGAPIPGHPQGTQAPAAPSPGYDPAHVATGDMTDEARKIKKAISGFNTDESKLIQILSKPDPLQMALLRQTYRHAIGKNLEEALAEKLKRDFGDTILALVRGPLRNDVVYLRNALPPQTAQPNPTPSSTHALLDDVLLRRSNADIHAITAAFKETYKTDLHTHLTPTNHISGPHHTLFKHAINAQRMEECTALDPALVEADADRFDRAPRNIDPGSKEETDLATLLAQRSDNHLRAVNAALTRRPAFSPATGTMTFVKKVKAIWARPDRKLMRRSALYVVRGALDGPGTDAQMLYKCMKGMGTRDSLLIARVVRLHWARGGGRVGEVKAAYRRRYERGLVEAVEKETSGDYEKALVALLDG
ncbi:hypothetical protein ACO22_06588 [Paracoccidioides brasiliensis]|uniref:Annexin n=1 Tax=Paracoccidioides brasiliensis TaxID=121759 RepID=A0A1D2J742_PARBR|nr:hypothetical protein ACO22_06588 [Paracoccidioides brasiliensis]